MNVEQKLEIILDDEATTPDRIRALEELRALKPSSAIVPLTLQLVRSGEELKDAIRAALAEMHATAVIAQDLDASDPDTRLKAAEMMALVPAPEGVDPLIRALYDPINKVRELCAAALWLYGDRRAIEPLIRLLDDSDPDVRCAAAQSLGRLGGGKAHRALEQAYEKESDDFARILIGESLTRIREVS
jgi:HEAT repeat protein